MLKTLRNKSKKLLILKIRFIDFVKKSLWQHAIVFSSIFLCAWIFNRWIEAIMFCIAHTAIRNAFDKQFHIINNASFCISITLAIIWFAIPITLPITTSLLSSIPIAFLICFFGYLAQDRLDMKKEIKNLDKYSTNLVMELAKYTEHKDIYAMTQEELYQHCRSRGLSEEDCRIAYFVVFERLEGKELYEALGYCKRQVIRKRKKILEKIK